MSRDPNAPRPERKNLTLKSTYGGPKPLDEVRARVPNRILDSHQKKDIADCCKDESTLQIDAFYVQGQEHAGVTKLEMVCGQCDRKHIVISGTTPAK